LTTFGAIGDGGPRGYGTYDVSAGASETLPPGSTGHVTWQYAVGDDVGSTAEVSVSLEFIGGIGGPWIIGFGDTETYDYFDNAIYGLLNRDDAGNFYCPDGCFWYATVESKGEGVFGSLARGILTIDEAPEPATWLLVAIGAGIFAGLRTFSLRRSRPRR
jgi:hypothetical protein